MLCMGMNKLFDFLLVTGSVAVLVVICAAIATTVVDKDDDGR